MCLRNDEFTFSGLLTPAQSVGGATGAAAAAANINVIFSLKEAFLLKRNTF